MGGKSKFQRCFLIFRKEDPGYGIGQGPSGYVKIEVRDRRGKLSAAFQNLRDGRDMYIYKLYLIEPKDRESKVVCAGLVPVIKNRGELKWEFDPNNVAMTGNGIDCFTVVALLVEAEDKRDFEIICPMAAYKDKKVRWRKNVNHALIKREEYEHVKVDISSGRNLEQKPGEEAEAVENGVIEEEAAEVRVVENEIIKEEVREARAAENEFVEEEMGKIGAVENKVSKDETGEVEAAEDEVSEEEAAEDGADEYEAREGEAEEDTAGENEAFEEETEEIRATEDEVSEDKKPQKTTVDLGKLKQTFDQYFEKHDPFQNKRRDYIWWKVGSPVHLNNILYQYNIRTPLLFNPAVMMSHFKYRHMIVGFYADNIRKLEYIVCGIPAVYESDSRPFGDMCRWVQLESGRPRYGAFGYWLVYIDPKTGKFLNMR